MATCKLNYIENAQSLENQDDIKQELTDIHFDIMSDLLSSQSESGSKLFTDVKLSSGAKVMFATSKLTSAKIHDQQRERINQLNAHYNARLKAAGYTGVGNQKVIEIKEVKLSPTNTNTHSIVAVHLLNYIPTGYTQEEIKEAVAELIFDIEPEVFDNGMIDTSYDVLSQVGEQQDAVLNQLEVLLTEADIYITNVVNNKNSANRLEFLNSSIKSLYWNIKNATDDVSKMANILDYMSKANSIATRLKNNVKATTKRINSLNKDSATYNTDISNIATYLHETQQIMEFLAPFKTIVESIAKDESLTFWSKYNLHKVVKGFKLLAKNNPTLVENLESALKNKISTQEELLNHVATALERTDIDVLRGEVLLVLEDATLKDSKAKAFEEIASNIQSIQTELGNDYYEFIATVLYNKQLERQRVNSKEEITDPKKLSYFEDKALIKKKLQLAESDISLTNMLFASGYDINDNIANLVTSVVDDYIRTGRIKNNDLTLTYEEDLQSIVSRTDEAKRKAWDNIIVQKMLTIDSAAPLVEVDPKTYVGPTYTKFGKTFKVRETNAIVGSLDRAKFNLDLRIHKETYRDRADAIVELLKDLNPSSFLSDDIVAKIEPDDFRYLLASKAILYSGDRKAFMINTSMEKIPIKLYYGFLNYHQKIKPDNQIQDILFSLYSKDLKNKANYDEAHERKIFTTEAMVKELNKKAESSFFRLLFSKKNVNSHSVRENGMIYAEERKKLFGNIQGGIMLRSPQGDFVFHKIPDTTTGKYKLPEEFAEHTYYSLGEQFISLQEYENAKFPAVDKMFQSDPKSREYYDFMIKKYNEANDKYEGNRFRFGELPFISTEKTSTFWETAKSKEKSLKAVKDWFKDFKYKDSNVRIKYGKDEKGNPIYLDKDNNPSDVPYYIQLNDSFGDPLREVVPGFTRYLNKDEQQETDLKVSMFMFNFAANEYESAATAANIAPVVKTILKGSEGLQIKARKSKKRDKNNNFLLKTGNVIADIVSERSTLATLTAIDTIVYGGDQKDTNVLGLSGKVASRRIKGLMAYNQLALNIKSGLTNFTFGTLSNYMMGASKKFGLSEKEIKKAYSQYRKNSLKYVADMSKSSLAQTSLDTQLATYFDAIKGNKEDGRTSINRKDPLSSGVHNLLFSTSTVPEHVNQLVLFKTLFNNYKILDVNGVKYTMGDFVQHQEGKAFTFDYKKLEQLGISRDEWQGKILEFTRVVTRANEDAHGQYDVLRKSYVQQHDLLSLGWVYSKWIYPGFKNRFKNEKFDYQSGEILDEGYLKTYFRYLLKDTHDMNENWEKVSFLKSFWEYAKGNPTKIPALMGSFVGKQAAGMFDGLSFKLLSKNNKSFKEWVYGDENLAESQQIAIVRANLELTYYMGAVLLGLIAASLSDDEEDDTVAYFLLKQVELQSKRTANDLGFYLMFTEPTNAYAKVRAKLQDPFIVGKLFDNNIGLLRNIFGFEYTFEDGLDFSINDQYERSGSGYEKGDYKVVKKLQKSVFSPIYQLYTFMNPDQSLKFMDMMNRK